MQKTRKVGAEFTLRPAFMADTERVLLSHVEMCYSVALALTRDPVLGQRLARATLLWAWQRQVDLGGTGPGEVKMALLKELRSRFLSDFHASGTGEPRQIAPFSYGVEREEGAVCAVATADHAETGTIG